jgi:hypothetical protein
MFVQLPALTPSRALAATRAADNGSEAQSAEIRHQSVWRKLPQPVAELSTPCGKIATPVQNSAARLPKAVRQSRELICRGAAAEPPAGAAGCPAVRLVSRKQA